MKKIIWSLALFALIFSSCKKDPAIEKPVIAGDNVNTFFSNNKTAPKTFTINSTISSTVKGDKGTEVSIPANAFKKSNGEIFSGNVDLQLIELFSKGDMILSGRPTITTDGNILESGGVVYLNAKAGNESLQLARPLTITVPNANPDPQMSLWIGSTTPTGDFAWLWTKDSLAFTRGTNYSFNFNSLTWINIDKLVQSTNTTQIKAFLPEGFDYEKSRAFIVFNDIRSVLEISNGKVNGYYNRDRLNIGAPITVLVIGEKNNSLYYSTYKTSVTESLTIYPEMTPVSQEELLKIVSSF